MEILVVWLIVWGICGFIASNMFESRGRSGCTGFALGFLFGPLGILIAAVTSPTPEFLERQQQKSVQNKLQHGDVKPCPFCAELIKSEAKVCRYCGRDLPSTGETQAVEGKKYLPPLSNEANVLIDGLRNPSAKRREGSAKSLGSLGDDDVRIIAALKESANNDSIDYVREAASSSLRTLQPYSQPSSSPKPITPEAESSFSVASTNENTEPAFAQSQPLATTAADKPQSSFLRKIAIALALLLISLCGVLFLTGVVIGLSPNSQTALLRLGITRETSTPFPSIAPEPTSDSKISVQIEATALPSPKPIPTTTPNQIANLTPINKTQMYVCVKSANIRSGPSTTADIVRGITSGSSVNVTGKTGEWYYLGKDKQGNDLFMHQSTICNQPPPTATPTDAASQAIAPTPAPASGGTGLSRSSPIPMGQSVIWTGHDGKQLGIKVLEFHRGDDAWQRIKRANSYNEPPPSGAEYLLMKMHIDFLRAGKSPSVMLGEDEFVLVSADGREFRSFEGPTIVPPDPQLLDQVYAGGSTDGWMAFTIIADDPHPVLAYGQTIFDDEQRVWFDLQ